MRNRILELLEESSHYTAEDISVMIGASIDEVKATIAELEKEQIVCGYKTLINWDKVEEKEIVTALIELKVTPQRGEGFDKIARRIYMFKEVQSVYLMSGGFDLTVIVEGRTMKDVAMFVGQKLATLDTVMGTATHFVLKKYKDHGVIFEEPKKDERMVISP
ncbi:MAG: AsnC family transcriptional regulator [Epulopiscium sp. Nele67-Bin004]|nr:MAG: AsnC family transcriptional regulator [Epulopiscium sp. Nele67-Bin004]